MIGSIKTSIPTIKETPSSKIPYRTDAESKVSNLWNKTMFTATAIGSSLCASAYLIATLEDTETAFMLSLVLVKSVVLASIAYSD